MPRLDSSTKTALNSDQFRLATLITYNFPTPIYNTDYGVNITYDSKTFTPSSHLISVSDAKETAGVKVNSMDITVSAVEQSFMSLFLSSDYINKQVLIQRAVIDDNNTIIGQPIDFFDGRIISFDMKESDSSSEISIEIASHWSDFDKIQCRRTNTNSQQFHFPDDRGFDYASSAITTLKWGRQ